MYQTQLILKEGSTNVLALGAELKNTICLTKDEKSFLLVIILVI